MAEAAGKDSGVPISELTLGEAESFLNSLMCLPEKTNNDGISLIIFQMQYYLVHFILFARS